MTYQPMNLETLIASGCLDGDIEEIPAEIAIRKIRDTDRMIDVLERIANALEKILDHNVARSDD